MSAGRHMTGAARFGVCYVCGLCFTVFNNVSLAINSLNSQTNWTNVGTLCHGRATGDTSQHVEPKCVNPDGLLVSTYSKHMINTGALC